MATKGQYVGETVLGKIAENVNLGQVIYCKSEDPATPGVTTGAWFIADADITSNPYGDHQLGIALETATASPISITQSGTEIAVLLKGYYSPGSTSDGGYCYGNLTEGAAIYLMTATTSGTDTKGWVDGFNPVQNGATQSILRVVGYAYDVNPPYILRFEPDKSWMAISNSATSIELNGINIKGATGPSGSHGTSGTSGSSGSSGVNGSSGTSGINGVIGSNGVSGSNGTSGSSGSSGVNGINGSSGTPGAMNYAWYNLSDIGSSIAANKMAGMSASITPLNQGIIESSFFTQLYGMPSGSNDLQIRYGTGTPPATGANSTGNLLKSFTIQSSAGSTDASAFSVVATGLTAGTSYWFDLCYTGAITTYKTPSIILKELSGAVGATGSIGPTGPSGGVPGTSGSSGTSGINGTSGTSPSGSRQVFGTTNSVVISANSTESISATFSIPAGSFTNGQYDFKAGIRKVGSATNFAFRVYYNTSPILSGANLIGLYNFNGANYYANFERTLWIGGSITTYWNTGISAITDTGPATVTGLSTSAIDWTTDKYIIMTFQSSSNAADTAYIIGASIKT